MNPIKQLINYEKITQKEFAEKIDVKQQYVNKLINGNVGIGTSVLKKIALCYPNINLKWLLEFPGEAMFLNKDKDADDSNEMESVIRYLYENNDRLLKNPMFKTFIESNIDVLRIEKEQQVLEEKKAEIKATLKEKLREMGSSDC